MIFLPLSLCRNRHSSLNLTAEVTSAIGRGGPLAIRGTSSGISSSNGRIARGTAKDVVSRNITMVLENLLMNYENSQLPTHGKGYLQIYQYRIFCFSAYNSFVDKKKKIQLFYFYTQRFIHLFISQLIHFQTFIALQNQLIQ